MSILHSSPISVVILDVPNKNKNNLSMIMNSSPKEIAKIKSEMLFKSVMEYKHIVFAPNIFNDENEYQIVSPNKYAKEMGLKKKPAYSDEYILARIEIGKIRKVMM